jgi:hypothetical protein
MQTFMITSVTRHQQHFSTRNRKVNGRNKATPGGMALTWKKPWNGGGNALRVDCECVCLLNIPRYIFTVRRLSILSKLDPNNPYRIWAELYFLNLNYLIILDTWLIWPSRRPRRSRFTSWSYLSFGPILFAAHLLVWPSYGNNNTPGQQVSPLVQYGMACLLIREAVKSVHCSNEWEIGVVTRLDSQSARGVMVPLLA